MSRGAAAGGASFGETHANTNRARCQLARAYLLSGRAADALAYAEITADKCRAAFSDNHAATREAEKIAAEARDALARSHEPAVQEQAE